MRSGSTTRRNARSKASSLSSAPNSRAACWKRSYCSLSENLRGRGKKRGRLRQSREFPPFWVLIASTQGMEAFHVLRDFVGHSPAHPDIVDRLPLMVRGDQVSAVPVTLLSPQLAAERGLKLVAVAGGKPRNSIAARSLRKALTRTDCLSAKIPMKPRFRRRAFTTGFSGGTESSQTLRWREMDSNL